VRDLRERDIRTKSRLLATGATRGGVPFGRGSLFYLLRNRFYVGEVKYKDEILPGEQPAIMDLRNVAFGLPNPKNSRQPTGIWPSKTLPRGTEFLDAETGGQNRAERPQVSPETERAERYRRKSPQKRPVLSRPGNLQFGGTGWWR
jgi:hypothetical protein